MKTKVSNDHPWTLGDVWWRRLYRGKIQVVIPVGIVHSELSMWLMMVYSLGKPGTSRSKFFTLPYAGVMVESCHVHGVDTEARTIDLNSGWRKAVDGTTGEVVVGVKVSSAAVEGSKKGRETK